MRPKILFVSLDPVGSQMSGLAIRYTELARALGDVADVTIGAPLAGTPPEGLRHVVFEPHAPRALRDEIARADAIVAHPQWPVLTRWMAASQARLVYDIYDPEALETLELFADRKPRVRKLMVDLTLDRLDDALAAGHHFVCASEKQRDLWLGAMMARRAIDPARYDADPTYRSVIDVVPFGVPDEAPSRVEGAPSIRDRFPQIGAGDEVVLWNGGLWRWLDAPTAIRAAASLAERRPGVRLVFMGASSGTAGRGAGEEARALADSLGLTGRTVFFNDGWVPYAERANWLLDAAAAISTHRDHLETRFAFRTRLLDCFWAGLPVVCTAGDDLSERVEREGLGAACAPGDAADAAAALERVLDRGREAHRDALASAAGDFAWSRVAEPLRRWVTDPAPAPERAVPRRRSAGHRLRAAAYAAGRHALARRSS